jgi:hypothetical protein
MKDKKFRIGKKGINPKRECWMNGVVQPTGTLWKRYFNKKIRKIKDLPNGNFYKRITWFEWC